MDPETPDFSDRVETYISEEEYLELDFNAGQIGDPAYAYEYYRGRVFAMAGESWDHSLIAGNIHDVLSPHFKERGCRAFRGDVRVKSSESYVYPDITVLCGEPDLTGQKAPSLLNPVLVVEVLSPSTEARDRTWKLDEYVAIPSLQEVWMVSQDAHRILRYFCDRDGWSMDVLEGIDKVLSSARFELQLRMEEAYEDVIDP